MRGDKEKRFSRSVKQMREKNLKFFKPKKIVQRMEEKKNEMGVTIEEIAVNPSMALYILSAKRLDM